MITTIMSMEGDKLVSMEQFANIAILESFRVVILLLTGLGTWSHLPCSILSLAPL